MLLKVSRNYLGHNSMNIVIMALLMGGIAFLWDDKVNRSGGVDVSCLEFLPMPCLYFLMTHIAKNCRAVHSLIIVVGSLVNMVIASFFGVLTPLVAARFNFDPSAIAGPFETAMQDMLGFMVLMFMARAVIESFGGSACPLYFGGNNTVTLDVNNFRFSCLVERCSGSLACYRQNC